MVDTAIRRGADGAPDLSSEERAGLRDLWQVYDAHYDEVTTESMEALARDAEFGPLLAGMSSHMVEEQNRRSRDMLRRAMEDDEWAAYVGELHEQGAGYATMGLSFSSWFRALSVIRPILTRHIREAFGSEPDRVFAVVAAMDRWFDLAMSAIGEAYLSAKQDTIHQQQEAIRELSTPVLTLMDGLLLLPVVGVIDSHRARQMTDQLLRAIHQNRAKVVVMDITGVAAVDSMVANHLVQAVEAARLLGAAAVITGVSAEVAQTVVKIGVDLARVRTVGDLQGGLSEAMRTLGYRLQRTEAGDDEDAA